MKKNEKPRRVYKSDMFWKYIDDALVASRKKYAGKPEAERAVAQIQYVNYNWYLSLS